MAEHYRFFDSTADDERVYTADEFAEYFRRVLTDGIFNGGTNLKVETNGTNLETYVQPGYAWLQGYMYKVDTEPLYLQHEYPDPTLDRIDRIVIRLDKRLEHRYVRAFILTGTPTSNPVPPTLTRDENVFELSLAQVRILKGKSYIEGLQITDERLNNNVCGLVNSLIQADTTSIFNQFLSWYNSQTAEFKRAWSDWFSAATSQYGAAWQDWFTGIQDSWVEFMGRIEREGVETPTGAQAKVDAHANRKDNPHGVTVAQIGAETPSGAQAKVDVHANRKDNPHGVTVSQIGAETPSGAQAKVDVHANRKDNPHGVTVSQIGAETPAGAQAKANTAETNAKAASLPRTGGTMTGTLTAQNNTSYTTKQVRNIILSTANPSGGANGDIWIKYKI